MNSKFYLIIIILLAAALRLWQIGSVPPSPDWDEAALGYNAYSILETGKDEYGEFLPVVLRSFDDYKPALYTYLVIPFIPLLGLDIIAIRLPSVIAGVIAVWLTYLLTKELISRQKTKNEWVVTGVPILAAFLLAISPWHIQFSRVAFETNIGVTLNIALVYFFLKGLRRPSFLSVAAMCAALSFYAYQSEKIFVPLLVLTLVIVYAKTLLTFPRKYLAFAFIVGMVVVLPILHFTFTNDDALARARSTSIFSNNQELLAPSVTKLIKAKEEGDLLGTVINNRRVVYAQTMFVSYISHYNPIWLFVTGDIERHHAPGMGLLYHIEFPFLLLGIFALLFSKKKLLGKEEKIVLFAWFLIAPLPASFTQDVPHAVRTMNFLPTFQIFTALGITILFSSQFSVLKNKSIKIVVFSALCFLFFINFIYYLHQYFVVQNKEFSKHWQYGYKEAVTKVSELESEYDKIVVSNQSPLDQSYIFFLYYLQYPPDQYQKEQDELKSFRKFEFRPIEWDKETSDGDILYIGRPKDFPATIDPLYRVSYLDGEEAMYFVSPQN